MSIHFDLKTALSFKALGELVSMYKYQDPSFAELGPVLFERVEPEFLVQSNISDVVF